MVPTLSGQNKRPSPRRMFSRGLKVCLSVGILFFLAISLNLFSASPARAQSQCGDRTSIVNILSERYAEKPVATGMTQGGGIIEIFAAKDGSWTMIVTMPTGHSCFMAAGKDWENFQQLAQGAKI
jgi:hypothetical protein